MLEHCGLKSSSLVETGRGPWLGNRPGSSPVLLVCRKVQVTGLSDSSEPAREPAAPQRGTQVSGRAAFCRLAATCIYQNLFADFYVWLSLGITSVGCKHSVVLMLHALYTR